MVGFYETNTLEDAEAIHAYLDRQQQRLPEMLEMTFVQKIEYWVTYGLAKVGEQFPGLLNATRDMSY
jgi:quinohemoprotein ethanol dehydrogenase